jgi:ElaB/YqjD/DUF883 family membrane-anchored ribosome-binding protein
MKDFKKLIREAHLGNPLNEEDRATRIDKMLSGKYEDEDYKDSERYADVRADLEAEMNEGYDDEDIVIYDGEEHIIMRRDGNMIYIRPLEDSAILGKKDEIKVPARALAYKSDLDKMYDEYKPKDEINEENEKYDHIARAEYGKPFSLLSIAQKQEMLSYMNRETEKEFETDFERRRKGDLDDEYDGMTDYQRGRMDEGFKKGDKVTYLGNPGEITFVGKDVMDRTYYSVAYDKGNGRTKASNLYNKDGEIKAVKEDMNDPVLVRARAAKIADEKEKSKQAELDKKYGSNFMDKLDAEISLKQELQDLKDEREQLMIDMEQEAEPEGGEIADRYGSRLNDIDVKMAEIKSELDDLRMYESVNKNINENTLGDLVKKYGKDLINFVIDIDELTKEEIKDVEYLDDRIQIHLEEPEIRQRYLPEGPDLNEDEIPSYLTKNIIFGKAVEDSVNFNDFTKRVYGILGPKYYKLTDQGALKDFYDSIRGNKPKFPVDLGEDDEFNVNVDNANDNYAKAIDAESRSGAYESLQESLRKKLRERLK